MKLKNLLPALGASGTLVGSIPLTSNSVGKPTIITPEVTTILVTFPYGQFVDSMDDGANYIRRLRDADQDNFNYNFENLLDQGTIQSLEDRLYDVFRQLARLNIMKPRNRHQKRSLGENKDSGSLEGSTSYGSTNIFQDAIGSIGEIFGVGSRKRLERLRQHINFVAKNLFTDQAELSSRLGTLAARMADSVNQLETDLGKILTDLQTQAKTKYAIMHNLRSLVEQSETAVAFFVEIRDQADLGLPSRMIMSEDALQKHLTNTTRTSRDLRPIYPNARNYFRLPMAETHIHQEKRMFTTVMRIPMTRHTEYFYKTLESPAYVRMTSNLHHVFLTQQEEVDCLKSATDIVCVNRPCRQNKYEDALTSCIVTRSETEDHADILELLYSEEHLKKVTGEKIVVNCRSKRMEFPVTKELIQIRLPQHCSVQNQYFSVSEVITSGKQTTQLQDNELTMNFKEVSLNTTSEELVSEISIKSPATIQIVEDLRQEARSAQELSKQDIEHAEEIDETYEELSQDLFNHLVGGGSVAIGLLVFAFFMCCCMFTPIYKKCMS